MNINNEHMYHYIRVGCGIHVRNYKLSVVAEEQNPRKVVGALWPGSQIRRYTPVYQYPNDGVRAGGDSSGYGVGILLKC